MARMIAGGRGCSMLAIPGRQRPLRWSNDEIAELHGRTLVMRLQGDVPRSSRGVFEASAFVSVEANRNPRAHGFDLVQVPAAHRARVKVICRHSPVDGARDVHEAS